MIEGRCLCGAVTVRVDGAHDPRPGACHCRMCQRWTGAVLMCFRAQPEAVTVEGPVRRYVAAGFAERAFCDTCGSHLWMRDLKGNDPYDLMPGLFDDARDWPLHSEIYIDRAMASVRLQGAESRRTRAEYEAESPHIEGET